MQYYSFIVIKRYGGLPGKYAYAGIALVFRQALLHQFRHIPGGAKVRGFTLWRLA